MKEMQFLSRQIPLMVQGFGRDFAQIQRQGESIGGKMDLLSKTLIVSGLSLFSAFSLASDFVGVNPIYNFHEVTTNGIYRGGAPKVLGVQWLSDNHFKTIIDLRIENPLDMIEEALEANRLDIKYIGVPMNPIGFPSNETMDLLEKDLLKDRSLQPLFIHCLYGEDRTGLVIGLYRVFDEGVRPEQAYSEMREYGFHPWLVNLGFYFAKVTGFAPYSGVKF